MAQDRGARPAGVGRGAGRRTTSRRSGRGSRRSLDLKRQEAACVGYIGRPVRRPARRVRAGRDGREPRGRRSTRSAGRWSSWSARSSRSGRRRPLEILERHYPADAPGEARPRGGRGASGSTSTPAGSTSRVHPFCTRLGPGDARITTRYDERVLRRRVLRRPARDRPRPVRAGPAAASTSARRCGEAVSLGIHESQSRMWENLVGRSRSFWEYFLPDGAGSVSRRAART